MDGLRRYYVHELNLEGIRSAGTYYSLIHPTVYYTLNAIPEGQKLSTSEVKSTDSGKAKPTTASSNVKKTESPDGKPAATSSRAVPTFVEIKPLLQKHTCLACHSEEKKVVGPAFKDIAKRKYSNAKIVELIYNPQPQNWPDYATPMAPMPHVPKADALKIASYINGLK